MQNRDLAWKIIGLYRDNPFEFFSINQIASGLKMKYPYVYKRTNELIDSGMVTMLPVGRSNLCALNLGNPFTRSILGYNELIQRQLNWKSEVDPSGASFIFLSNKKVLIKVHANVKYNSIKKGSLLIKTMSVKRFIEELKDIGIENHLILYGFERYTEFIFNNQAILKVRYNKMLRDLI